MACLAMAVPGALVASPLSSQGVDEHSVVLTPQSGTNPDVVFDGFAGVSDSALTLPTGDTVVRIAGAVYADVLVVGGGGGGGFGGGGGGAVCERIGPTGQGFVRLEPGTHSVVVGSGGVTVGQGGGEPGTSSSFAGTTAAGVVTVTAPGGGRGAGNNVNAGSGGSGGGGAQTGMSVNRPGAGAAAPGANCTGNQGGAADSSAGGGGGAGAAGGSGTRGASGAGGSGRQSVITGQFYGGGGGGGRVDGMGFSGAPGAGGAGGGASGGSSSNGGVGGTNTGGGGGGGGWLSDSTNYVGGSGGRGVVVVRTPASLPLSVISGHDSVTTTTTGGIAYRLHWFTTAGNRTLTVTVDPNPLVTHSGVISGDGSLVLEGPGQLALSVANSFSGVARAKGGSATLRIRHAEALQNATLDMRAEDSGAVAFDGADLEYRMAGLTGSRNLGLNAKRLQVTRGAGATQTYSGALSNGDMVLVGDGITVLTGANTLTATTVSAGVLQVGDGGAAGALGSGPVYNDASLVIDRTGTLTMSNAISGAGTLTKRGAGTLALTGTSTFTGVTTVSAGVLQVGAGGSAGALGSGPVYNDASLVIDRTGTLTMGNAISGTGTVTKRGAGTLVLAGENTYSGATTVETGVMELTGSLGATAVSVNSGAWLVIDRNDSVTMNHVIDGSGTFAKRGAGTVMLTGANTLAGTIRVESGVLQVGVGGGAGALGSGPVVNDASLVIDRSDTLAMGNVVSGTGTLVKRGAGTLVLSGNSTFTGATTVSAGVLQVGDGGGAGALGAGPVHNDASLVIDRTGTLTMSNAMGGMGMLVKRGAGTLVLTGASTFTGATTVESGTLRVNGSVGASAVTVQGGATLSGVGELGASARVLSGASHAPGASPGVQTFGNGVSYESGSSLQWELAASTTSGRGTNFDGVDVTGGVLDIEAAVTSQLVFDAAGSTVDWRDAFWADDHEWVVFENAAAPQLASARVFDMVTMTADSAGRSLAAERERAYFRWATRGNDVVLQYWAPRPLLSGAQLEIVAGNDPTEGERVSWDVVDGVLYLLDAPGRTDMVVRVSRAALEAKLAAGDVSVSTVSMAGTAPLVIPTGRTFTVSQSGSSTYGGAVSGGGGFVKAGSGALTLSGASTFTGGVTVSAGRVVAGGASAFGTGVVSVVSGASVDVAGHNVANAFGVAGSGVSGTGAIANSGPGAAVLSGAITLRGAATLRGPDGFTVAGGVTGPYALTLGTTADAGVTISAAVNVTGPLVVGSASVRLDADINVAGGRVEFEGVGGGGGVVSATANGSITALELLVRDTANVFLGAPAQMTVATVAATGVGRFVLSNTTDLTVGTVAGVSGVDASGRVDLSTVSGDLTLAALVATTVSRSATGLRLAAGTATPFGVASGGDVKISGQGAVSAVNAVTQVFSGSAPASTGLSAVADAQRVGTTPSVVAVGQVAVAYRHSAPEFLSPSSMRLGDTMRVFATTVTGSAASYTVVSGPCTVDDDVVEAFAAGTCVVEASDAAGATSQHTITVNRMTQSVELTTAPPAQVSAGVTYTPTASATSGLPVVIDIASGSPTACSLANGVVTFTGVGTCVIRAQQAGDATVAAATVTQTVVASRINRTVRFDAVDDRTVASPPFRVTASAGTGVTVTFSASTPGVCSVGEDTGIVRLHGIGTCSITAMSTGDAQVADAATTQSFVVHAATPSRASVTSVTAGDTTATVAFVPPAHDGGTPLLGHRVVATPHPDDGGDEVVLNCGPVSPCAVAGLTNGTRYTFTVAAFNAAGVGEVSLPSPEVIPADTSMAVRELRTTPGDGVLRVDWEAPTSMGGGVFVSYDVYRRSHGGNWEGPVSITDADADSHTFTSVTNGVAYDVKIVTITTAVGTELVANTSKAMGVAPQVPTSPRRVTLSMLTPTSFLATWVAPLGDGGSPVLSYDVTPACEFDQPNDTFCVFTNQPRGTLITVNVAAVNLLGVSDATTSGITLPALPPSALLPPVLPSLINAPTTNPGSTTPPPPPVIRPPTVPTVPTRPPTGTGTGGATTPASGTSTNGTTPTNGTVPATVPGSNTTGSGTATGGTNGAGAGAGAGANGTGGTDRPSTGNGNGNGTDGATLTPSPTPVRLPGPEFVPGGEPRAVVGGRPVTVETTPRDDGGLEVGVGSARLTFVPPAADAVFGAVGRPANGGESPGLVAVEGRGTPLRGEGLMPGSTLQVLLTGLPQAPGWGSESDSMAVARIPVGADGSFDGEMSLGASIDQPPVPIGQHVVQIAAFDADGNQVVVETTINVAQHAPRPELDRSVGRIPAPAPGQLVATAAGRPTNVELITADDGQGLSVDGGDWSLGVQATDAGTRIEVGDAGVTVTLAQAGTFTTGGTGLQPGSRADIWMFSEPTLLGTTTVDDDGNFTFDITVDPRYIGPGTHTLQVQGVAPDGYVRAVSLGVNVEPAVTVAGIPSSSERPSLVALVPAIALAGIVIWFFVRRRRRDDESEATPANP